MVRDPVGEFGLISSARTMTCRHGGPPAAAVGPANDPSSGEAGIAQLAWSRSMHDGVYRDRQPESLTSDEWEALVATL